MKSFLSLLLLLISATVISADGSGSGSASNSYSNSISIDEKVEDHLDEHEYDTATHVSVECTFETILDRCGDTPLASIDEEAYGHRTLRDWDIRIDEALFLGGMSKGQFLQAYQADVFFDDQQGHIDSASQHVASGHVPHGVTNTKPKKEPHFRLRGTLVFPSAHATFGYFQELVKNRLIKLLRSFFALITPNCSLLRS